MITHYQKSQLKTISKYHDKKKNKQVTCLDNVVRGELFVERDTEAEL